MEAIADHGIGAAARVSRQASRLAAAARSSPASLKAPPWLTPPLICTDLRSLPCPGLIDIVVVNLYPFRETVNSGASQADCVEKIDIGAHHHPPAAASPDITSRPRAQLTHPCRRRAPPQAGRR